MAEAIKKYRLPQYKDGRIALIIEDDEKGECFVVLSKLEIKELIQDLLKYLRPAFKPSVARVHNKS